MKKFSLMLLAVVMTMAMVAFSASAAEGDVKISVSKVEVVVGTEDAIEVPVLVEGEGVVAVDITVSFDESKLTYSAIAMGDYWPTADEIGSELAYIGDVNKDVAGEVRINYASAADVEEVTKTEGKLFTLKFLLADDVAAGDKITLTLTAEEVTAGVDEAAVPEANLDLVDGEVSVIAAPTAAPTEAPTTAPTVAPTKAPTTAKGANTGDVAIPAAAAVVALLCGGVVVAMKKRG